MMTLTSSLLNSPLDAASVEQARCLRAFSKTKLAKEISISSRTYTRYLDEGFPDDIKESLSNVLSVPTEFLSSTHPDMLELSNFNFLAGRMDQAALLADDVATGILLT